jgi:lipid-A-disaccharide synthase
MATIFLIAGEPSADTIGARLMAALGELAPGTRFQGIGGPRMAAAGLESLFPMDELSVMGFLEVVPHLPRLLRRMRETELAVRRASPDVLVTIDSPGFNLRLLERLRDLPIRKAHYVAPQAWAWKERRAARLGRLVDRVLLLLPFEAAFFARFGVPCAFVGHPIVEELPAQPDPDGFRARHGLGEAPLIALMPGSREAVARRHLPVLGEAVARLRERVPGLLVVIPTVPGLVPLVRDAVAAWPGRALVLGDRAERFHAFAAARLAIASSGTVSLEAALARLPLVTIYRTGALTAFLARRLINVRYVNLINLILDRPVVPELLQERCRPATVAAEALALLEDDSRREAQRSAMAEVARLLGGDSEEPPSRRAAREVLALLG